MRQFRRIQFFPILLLFLFPFALHADSTVYFNLRTTTRRRSNKLGKKNFGRRSLLRAHYKGRNLLFPHPISPSQGQKVLFMYISLISELSGTLTDWLCNIGSETVDQVLRCPVPENTNNPPVFIGVPFTIDPSLQNEGAAFNSQFRWLGSMPSLFPVRKNN